MATQPAASPSVANHSIMQNVTNVASSSSTAAAADSAFDWYSDPHYYDMIFEDDTEVETMMLREMARVYVPRYYCCQQQGKEKKNRANAASSSSTSSSSTSASSSSASILPPLTSTNILSRHLLCLEPACGSGRLMLSLADEFPQWSFVGFDISPGAVEYARRRWKEKCKEEDGDEDQEETFRQLSRPPRFTVFHGDMTNFSSTLATAIPLPPSSSLSPLRFDFAHCLVSSLKHLLEWSDVSRHFEEMHRVMREGGVYVLAVHVHTLNGKTHFETTEQLKETVRNASSDVTAVATSLICDPTEIEEFHESTYTRGDTKIAAELITFRPDAELMVEKMIARVHVAPPTDATSTTAAAMDTSSSVATAATASSSSSSSSNPATSSASMSPSTASTSSHTTTMSLRVYSLSSLHTVLCAISHLFELVATFSYADIYQEKWNVKDFEVEWPYPNPSVEQLNATSSSSSSATAASLPPPLTTELLRQHQNWNDRYSVSDQLKEEWEGVESVAIVLKNLD